MGNETSMVVSADALTAQLVDRRRVLEGALVEREREARRLEGRIGEVNYWLHVIETNRTQTLEARARAEIPEKSDESEV